MSAIFGFTFDIGRMTEVLTPDIYRAHWPSHINYFNPSKSSHIYHPVPVHRGHVNRGPNRSQRRLISMSATI